jgi:hypothetical protein
VGFRYGLGRASHSIFPRHAFVLKGGQIERDRQSYGQGIARRFICLCADKIAKHTKLPPRGVADGIKAGCWAVVLSSHASFLRRAQRRAKSRKDERHDRNSNSNRSDHKLY